jgi:hypothetical protein
MGRQLNRLDKSFFIASFILFGHNNFQPSTSKENIMSNCDHCAFRKKYDNAPQSFLGRLWKWHIRWCPGWKSHLRSQPEEKRAELLKRYQ